MANNPNDEVTADGNSLPLSKESMRINKLEYEKYASSLQHIFLTGNLQQESLHPFFYDDRVELIYCHYQPGDDGSFHWHEAITEYQIVISGAFGVQLADTEEKEWFLPGDVSRIRSGMCVKRIIETETITIAIKVPSIPGDKVQCESCNRNCRSRQLNSGG